MPLNRFRHILSWDEFSEQNRRPSGVGEDAHIAVSTTHEPTVQGTRRNAQLSDLTTNISVAPSSWVVRDRRSTNLLAHEQVHFDISALGAREIHNRMLSIDSCRLSELRTQMGRITRDVQRKIRRVNSRYDEQTNHGMNSSQQEDWETKIRAEKDKENGLLSNLL